MRNILLLVLFIFSGSVYAQNVALDQTFNVADEAAPGGGPDDRVYSIIVLSDGKMLIGGSFSTYDGVSRRGIARLNADGTLDETFDPGTGVGVNGEVYDIAVQTDGKIVIGGNFSNVNGESTIGIGRLNDDGTYDITFDGGTGVNGVVNAVSVQSDGKILVGGSYLTMHGVARNGIARLNSNGTLDTTFDPGTGVNTSVSDVVGLSDGKILFCGSFTTYNGTAVNYLARVSDTGALDATFNTGDEGPNSWVEQIAFQEDGQILIVGSFSTYNDLTRQRVARLNTNGTLDGTFTTPNFGVNQAPSAVVPLANGQILIGGGFSQYSQVTREGVARLDSDGTLDETFDVGTGASFGPFDQVSALAVQSDGQLLVGGLFGTFNGEGVRHLVRLETDGSVEPSFFTISTGVNGATDVVVEDADNKLLIGGEFTTVNGVLKPYLARLHSNGLVDNTFNTGGSGPNYHIFCITILSDNKIMIGGSFTTYNGVARNRIARLHADGTLDTSFDPGTGANGVVSSIIEQPDGQILVGGWFGNYNGATASKILRLNTNGSIDNTFNAGTGPNSFVYDMVRLSDGKIVVVGSFNTVAGTARNRIARLNSDGTHDTSFNPGNGASSTVEVIELQSDGKFLIGGIFTTYNSSLKYKIARVNADGSLDGTFTPGNMTTLSTVKAIKTLADGTLLIGGQFTAIGAAPHGYIAALNDNGSVNTAWQAGTGFNSTVHEINQLEDGKVIVGGIFSSFNGSGKRGLAKIYKLLEQSITDFGALANKTYGDATFDLAAQATSGLAVEYASSNTDVATVSGNTVTIVGAGQTNIVASQPGDTEYAPATAVQQSLTVGKKNLTISGVVASDKIYDGTAYASSTGGSLVGVVGDDAVVQVIGSSTFDSKDVGVDKTVTFSGYSLDGADAGKYTVEQPPQVTADITPKEVTVVNLIVGDKAYDASTDATVQLAVLSGAITDDDVLLEWGTGAFDDSQAGTDKTVTLSGFEISGDDAANYSLVPPGTVTADILPKEINVTAGASQSKVYGDSDPLFTYLHDPALLSGDSFAGSLARNAGESTGSYSIQQGTLSAGPNYSIVFTGADFSITPKALTITGISALDKTYDGTVDATAAGGELAGIVGSDDVTITPGTAIFGDDDAGNDKPVYFLSYALAGADAGNYTVAQPSSVTADILPKELTVTGVGVSDKVYDGSTDAIPTAGTLVGVIEGDDILLHEGSASFADSHAGPDKSVTFSDYSISGGHAANYALTQPAAVTADIHAKAIIVYANTGQSKVYGESDPVLAYYSDPGLISGDNFTGALTRTAGEQTGSYSILQGTLTAGANYNLTYSGTDFVITQKGLTISGLEALGKTYDGNTSASFDGGTLVGVVPGDDVTFITGSASFSTPDAGEDRIVSFADFGLLGTDATQYTLTQPVESAADILPKSLTISGIDVSDKTYDGTVDATFSSGTLSGIVAGDEVSVIEGNAAFATSDAGDGISVSFAGFSLNGSDASNYALVQPDALTASILPLAITISPDPGQYKIYGEADNTLVFSSTPGIIEGDDFTGALQRENGEDVGSYSILAGTLSAGTNYTITLAPGEFEIAPRTVEVTGLTIMDKVYDGTTAAQVSGGVLSGVINDDDVTLVHGTASFADQHAGSNKLITLTGYTITGAHVHNYVLSETAASSASILPKEIEVVVVPGQGKTYGDPEPALAYLADPLVDGDSFSGELSRSAGEQVGQYSIDIGTLSAGSNYVILFSASPFGISPKVVTAKGFSGTIKTYDGTTAAHLSGGYLDGLVPGDDVQFTPLNAVFDSRHTGQDKTISLLTYEFTGEDVMNYMVSTPDFSGIIQPKEISVQGVSILPKAYDGTTSAEAEVGNLLGIIEGDLLNAGAVTGTFAQADVGTGIAVQVSIPLEGMDATNYYINDVEASGNIIPLVVTIAPEERSKTYGDGDPVLPFTAVPLLIGDDEFTGSLSREAGEGVGEYMINQGSLSAGTNYQLAIVSNIPFTIHPREASLIGASVVEKAYDGTTAAAVTGGTLAGIINGDAVTLLEGTAEFIDANAGSNKAVVLQGYSLEGADASNYTFITPVDIVGTISPKPISVTATPGQQKTFGEQDPALTYTSTPALLNNDSFSGALVREQGENAGTYVIQLGSLSAGNNYDLAFTPGTFIILKAAQQITFDLGFTEKLSTDDDFQVEATASSGLPVSFAIGDGPATVASATISLTGEPGTVVVVASQPGDQNHFAAENVSRSFEVKAVVGVENPRVLKTIEAYPNPASGKLFITSDVTIRAVSLHDLNGRVLETHVVNNVSFEVDVERFPAGKLILAYIETREGTAVRKILIGR